MGLEPLYWNDEQQIWQRKSWCGFHNTWYSKKKMTLKRWLNEIL